MTNSPHIASENADAYAVNTGVRAVKLFRPAKPRFEKGSAAALLAALDEIAKLGRCNDEFPDADKSLLPLDDIDLGSD